MTYIVRLSLSQPGMPPAMDQYLSHGCATRIKSQATKYRNELDANRAGWKYLAKLPDRHGVTAYIEPEE